MNIFDLDDPEGWEKAWKKELATFYTELKYVHARRQKQPLKFVEFFVEVENKLHRFANSGWESVEKEHGYVKKLLEKLRPDYLACLRRANEQVERRAIWDSIYRCPVRIVEGGRADGNSR